ncbi:MAG: cobalamin-binding protein [Planctomycetes bacterium]|nr:cobalamin-binding protein [Planctomycetota bacterium]
MSAASELKTGARLQRIASLLSSATEMLYGLGLGDQIVAVSHECNFPPECLSKPRVTRTSIAAAASSASIDAQVQTMLAAGEPLYSIDTELLASLRPDLIVTQAQCDVCAVKYDDVLQVVAPQGPLPGVPVVALNPYSLEAVLSDILRVGRAVDRAEAAKDYVARLRERIAQVVERTADVPASERPTVGCIEWIEPLMIAANWMPEMIEMAGGRQQLSVGGQHSTYTPWQSLVTNDPDVILIMPCGFNLERTLAEAESLRTKPGWQDLRAVQTGRVFACDGDALFNRSGPRLVDSLELMARLFHPQRWKLDAKVTGETGMWQQFS